MEQRYPNFAWWHGIVEDRNDPDKLGRYRVRILGHHTKNKEILPTEDLPWALSMQSITSAAISGVGTSPTGLVEGSSVIGFFVDGEDGQIPVIMGSVGGMSVLPGNETDGYGFPDTNMVGFYDPNKKFPRTKGKNEDGDEVDTGQNELFEADSPRLARGPEKSEAHISLLGKRKTRVKKVPMGFASSVTSPGAAKYRGFTHPKSSDGESINVPNPKYNPTFWNEPHPQGAETSKSTYPYNHVRETESGHVFEVDDTPGAERIHEYHTSGTFKEIMSDGTRVTKIIGDEFEIDLESKYLYVKGDFNITVEGDYNLNVKGNKYEHISGHSFTTVKGSRVSKIMGNEEVDTQSNMNIHVSKNRNVQIGSTDGNRPSMGNDRLRVSGELNTAVRGKTKHIVMADRKDITFGSHKINCYPRIEASMAEAIKGTLEGADPSSLLADNFIKGGKLELFGMADVSIATDLIYPNPITQNVPAVSISTARYNLAATADLYEKIGPLSSLTGARSAAITPGYATRLATVGINNVQGVDLSIPLLPGIQNSVLAGGIVNNITAGGIVNNITAGGIVTDITAGGIAETITAGGYTSTVTTGGINIDVKAGVAKFGNSGAGATQIGGATSAVTITGATIALV